MFVCLFICLYCITYTVNYNLKKTGLADAGAHGQGVQFARSKKKIDIGPGETFKSSCVAEIAGGDMYINENIIGMVSYTMTHRL